MVPKMIFGLGTGRCGTWTLHKVFAAQLDVAGKHEGVPLPWEKDEDLFYRRLFGLWVNIDSPVIASVSYVWINYIGTIMGNIKDPRCICLKRPREQVVESFMAHSPNNNHWTDPDSLSWDPNKDTHTVLSYQWPKYDLPKRKAIRKYWDEYYTHAQYLETRYPDNFKIFSVQEALNSPYGQREMLKFAGIDANKQVLVLNQRLNALHKPKGNPQESVNV